MNLRVSVVIPAYNAARDVGAAIESALAQTYRDVDVCVLDDGSTDETRDVVARFGERVRYRHQANRGLPAARNAGAQLASGEALIFLDADDTLTQDCVARHMAAAVEHPEAGLTYSRWVYVDEHGGRLGEPALAEPRDVEAEILLRTMFFFPSAAMIHRDWLERVGWFDESLRWSEDADLWLRLARAGCRFAFIDAVLMRYRIRSDSMTAQVNPDHVAGWQAVLRKYFATPALPQRLRELEPAAYGVLHYETAGRYLRAGERVAACQALQAADAAWPAAPDDWIVTWAAGTAANPRTRDPQALLGEIFALLPPRRRGLERRAWGDMHAALMFEHLSSGQVAKAWRHAVRAVLGHPAWLTNTRFLRALLAATLRPAGVGRRV